MKLDTLFSPMAIGTCEAPNRLVVPAMVTNYCTHDGIITERYLRYMEERRSRQRVRPPPGSSPAGCLPGPYLAWPSVGYGCPGRTMR